MPSTGKAWRARIKSVGAQFAAQTHTYANKQPTPLPLRLQIVRLRPASTICMGVIE